MSVDFVAVFLAVLSYQTCRLVTQAFLADLDAVFQAALCCHTRQNCGDQAHQSLWGFRNQSQQKLFFDPLVSSRTRHIRPSS